MSSFAPILRATRFSTPIGTVVCVVDARGALVYLDFDEKTGPTPPPGPDNWRGTPVVWVDIADHADLERVADEIGAYFDGSRRSFDLPVAPSGNTFNQAVWAQLRRIPYGETISYGELARRLSLTNGARAVGRANGSNPIAIVIPCHRVIGADGKLTGYSGGIERKAALLALEQASTPLGQHTLPLGVAPGKRYRKR